MDAEMNHNSEFQQITLIKQRGKFKEKFLLLGQGFPCENPVCSCAQAMPSCVYLSGMFISPVAGLGIFAVSSPVHPLPVSQQGPAGEKGKCPVPQFLRAWGGKEELHGDIPNP